MPRKPKIYVAGPYTKGDPVVNTKIAIETGIELIAKGFVPYVPHLTMFMHLLSPQPYEVYIEQDFEWVDVCDGLLRLPGDSSGADREILRIVANGKPVFYSRESLYAWKNTWRG